MCVCVNVEIRRESDNNKTVENVRRKVVLSLVNWFCFFFLPRMEIYAKLFNKSVRRRQCEEVLKYHFDCFMQTTLPNSEHHRINSIDELLHRKLSAQVPALKLFPSESFATFPWPRQELLSCGCFLKKSNSNFSDLCVASYNVLISFRWRQRNLVVFVLIIIAPINEI